MYGGKLRERIKKGLPEDVVFKVLKTWKAEKPDLGW